MRSDYLIYHPKREKERIGPYTVYYDKLTGNQDPYIWNEKFLHTFCHITQMTNEKNQINFWVSGDTFPKFTKLYCDCVFVIDKKYPWQSANQIDKNNPIVD